MAYKINKSNGTILTTLLDGTLDRNTSLSLVGRNYAGYGEAQNENFVFLLENFASSRPPTNPLEGQLWFYSFTSEDSTQQEKNLNVCELVNGKKQFKRLSITAVSDKQPDNLQKGEFWWDTTKSQLFGYDGSNFDLIGPEKAGDGITRFRSYNVEAQDKTKSPLIVGTIENEAILVVSSKDTELNSSNFSNFAKAKKGITLANDAVLNGSSTNSYKLDGVSKSQFLRSDIDTTLDGTLNIPSNNTGVRLGSSLITQDSGKLMFDVPKNVFNFVDSTSNKIALQIDTSNEDTGLAFFGNKVWHAGYHGSGSGLDADLLDGRQADEFLLITQSASDSEKLGGLDSSEYLKQFETAANARKLNGLDSTEYFKIKGDILEDSLKFENIDDGLVWDPDSKISLRNNNMQFDLKNGSEFVVVKENQEVLRLSGSNILSVVGHTVWHRGNQGPNSGLDSDTLDGKDASEFLLVDGKAQDSQKADFATRAFNSDTLNGFQSSDFVQKSSGGVTTITGVLALEQEPVQDNHAATKKYVDDFYAIKNSFPIWAGNTNETQIANTFSEYPIGTRVSFQDERTVRKSANSNGGYVTFTDKFSRTIEKKSNNVWREVN